jgi:cytochrome b subunit of formate dehydrogenase
MVVRFTLIERIQHIILFITLIMLSLTGLSLKFHDSWFGRWMVELEGGFEARGQLHNIFAFILMGLAVFHAFYIIFSEHGHQQLMRMKFKLKDLKNFILVLQRNFGRTKEKPQFEKFTFTQKFQYWGVVVGCIVMIITGIILMLKVMSVAMVFPKWLWDIIAVVHGYEGLLIFVVLFVWHLYDVHLSPGSFPMQKTWLTGTISRQELQEKYPLEYERLFGKGEELTP